MKIFYIAPSVMPSRSAHSVHIARMCEALSATGHELFLFIKSPFQKYEKLKTTIEEYYKVNLAAGQIIAFTGFGKTAITIQIALMSVLQICLDAIRGHRPDIIISRNLYASFLMGFLFRQRIIFETHYVERGFRSLLQRSLLRCSWVKTVVVSWALKTYFTQRDNLPDKQIMVLPDAAPAGIKKLSAEEKRAIRFRYCDKIKFDQFRAVVGYFGHLYPGRGIEIIQHLAMLHPDVAFIVFGGNEEDLQKIKNRTLPSNLYLMGYLQYSHVLHAMGMMDVLLMPYQKQVYIGMGETDTAQWMSPMKMFEYMAVGVPFIASRLPVLEEVLVDGRNCLLAIPDDPVDWSNCLNRLLDNQELANRTAITAHEEYEKNYTWLIRAQKMIDLVSH